MSARPMCEQRCGAPATVYAIDPVPGGWGGRYCEPCAKALRFRVVDRLTDPACEQCGVVSSEHPAGDGVESCPGDFGLVTS